MNLEETYRSRLAGVRKYLTDKGLDGALFTSYENRRYYCGFTGSNGYLIVTDTEAKLITDPRYTAQAQLQTTKDCQVIEYLYDRLGTVAKTVKAMGITALVLESSLTLDEYLPLKEQLGNKKHTITDRLIRRPVRAFLPPNKQYEQNIPYEIVQYYTNCYIFSPERLCFVGFTF